ncbi:MAG: oligosaccharide flippase family protein, partial [Chloroflexi bacterium]|nr:oligosaccharide flippase family protein [Chloroflexota bacterium]
MRRIRPDLLAAGFLLLLVALFLGKALFTGMVLLPIDNLFLYPPWKEFAARYGIGIPNNHLIGDAILQNISWKAFARESLAHGEIPLWNPYLLSGVPFLAAGQYGVLYPLGALFYVVPLPFAYAWFIGLHLFLAGLFAYIYLRVIDLNRWGALFGGVAFAFCGFLLTSFQWPMIVSTAVWLPLLLAFVELVIRDVEHGRGRTLLWVVLGAVTVAMQFLAGHMEISFYILFSAGFYTLARLVATARQVGRPGPLVRAALAALLMVGLGTALAAVQIAPFAEAIRANFRSGYVGYQQVAGYALPKDHVFAFLMPDFFGNPSHHSFFDLRDFQTKPVGDNALGRPTDPPQTIFWGRKNYVEGAAYVGILTLLLAGLALLTRRNRYTWIFAAFGAFSLSLAFGAPWYRIFFFGVPGFDQLHTPFRWLFPYMVSVIALAGMGAARLADGPSRALERLKWGALGLGLALLAGLVATLLWRERAFALAGRFLSRVDRLQTAFADGTMLYSYEFRNALLLALALLGSAAVLWVAARRWRLPWAGGVALAPLLALLVLAADLLSYSASFNTAADPRLLDFVPPAIAALPKEEQPYRVVSFGEEDILPPNSGMLFGLQDTRGYDTIIPKQYVEYWGLMEEPQGLIYSKIHKLVRSESLRSPFLDLLNVEYILSARPLDLPLVFDGATKVYRNPGAMPRAFLAFSAESVASPADSLARLKAGGFDPRQHIVLEGAEGKTLPKAGGPAEAAEIVTYSPQRVVITTQTAGPAVLVLLDSYFPGWQASIDGVDTTIYRAQHNFRGVLVGSGSHTVEFRYRPLSFRLGLLASGLAGLVLLLLLAMWAWQRARPAPSGDHVARGVAKNTLVPMTGNLLNKAVDLAFAALMLRMLGADNVGKYTFAIVLVGYFEIFTNFGMNTLLTREVARDASQGNRYVSHTTILRLLLWLGSGPFLAGIVLLWSHTIGMSTDMVQAIALLSVALVPGNIAASLSALFYAHEKMEYPAVISIVTTLVKVALGVPVLLAGWSFVGLAAVSVATNTLTAGVFAYLTPRHFFRPRPEFEVGLTRGILATSWPLMVNHLLATLFFRVDVLIMQAVRSSRELGYYSMAYKFIDGLNVIPSTFTFALFPVLSRYAVSSQGAFVRAYTMATKTLLLVSVPLAVGTALLAKDLVLLVGGEQYLPDSMIALQILIWFLPFSYINSVTQYVLIALEKQRYLTGCFVAGALFNLGANSLLIPRYGYIAASAVTVCSELVLLVPFMYGVRQRLGTLPSLGLVWR